jgi:F0F1-type ATP synthase assembly protein I
MNCCGHNKQEHANHNKKHILMMALCCGLPVLILMLLPLLKGIFPGASLVLGGIVPFLCPVMMFIMMFFMFRDGKSESAGNDCHTETKQQ